MFNKNNQSQIYLRKELVLIKEQRVREVKLLYDLNGIKIISMDRFVEFNLELPIPNDLTVMSGNTVYFQCEPSSFDKNDFVYEQFDVSQYYLSINQEYYFFNWLVLTFKELSPEKGWLSIAASFRTEDNKEIDSHMNLYVKVESDYTNSKEQKVSNPNVSNPVLQSLEPLNTGSKPITQLLISDFDNYPIWEWAIDEEEKEEQDETWIRPAKQTYFSKELNGSLVRGEIEINNLTSPCIMELKLKENLVEASNCIIYTQDNDEFTELKDFTRELTFPEIVKVRINIFIEGKQRFFKAEIKNPKQLYLPIVFSLY